MKERNEIVDEKELFSRVFFFLMEVLKTDLSLLTGEKDKIGMKHS